MGKSFIPEAFFVSTEAPEIKPKETDPKKKATPKKEATKKVTAPSIKLEKKALRKSRLQLVLTEELFNKLHDKAEETGLSMNEICIQAIEQIL